MDELKLWVQNDEHLYTLWTQSGAGLDRWVRENKEWLRKYVESRTNKRPN